VTGKRRTIDLDAVLGEAEVVEVKLRGETFELPATMPMLVPAKLTTGDVVGAVSALVGPDRADAFLARIGLNLDAPEQSEFGVLMREVYGLDMGEPSASANS
jgi:hypothetical protein